MHNRIYMYYKWQLNFLTCSIAIRMLFLSINTARNILINILSGGFICKIQSWEKVIILLNTFLVVATSAMRCDSKNCYWSPFLCLQCGKTKHRRNINFTKCIQSLFKIARSRWTNRKWVVRQFCIQSNPKCVDQIL